MAYAVDNRLTQMSKTNELALPRSPLTRFLIRNRAVMTGQILDLIIVKLIALELTENG
jgi:hypothetical protein